MTTATSRLQTPCTKSGRPLCLDPQPMTFNFGSLLLRYFSKEISWLFPPHQSPSYSNAVVFHYNCIFWSLITPGLWTVRRVTLHQHSPVGSGDNAQASLPGWGLDCPRGVGGVRPISETPAALWAWKRALELVCPRGRGCSEEAGVPRAFS